MAERVGTLCLVEPDGRAGDAAPARESSAVLLAALPGEIVCAQQNMGTKLQIPLPRMRFLVSIKLDTVADDAEQPSRLMMGAGFTNSKQPDHPVPARLYLTAAPAAILLLANAEGNTCEIRDGTLTVGNDWLHLSSNAATGELLECSVALSEEPTDKITIAIEPDGWAKHLAAAQEKIGQQLGTLPNAYEPDRPLGSISGYLLGTNLPAEMFSWLNFDDEQLQKLRGVCATMQKLAEHGLLQPVDEWLARPHQEKDDSFFIPASSDDPVSWAYLAPWVFPPIEQAFPHGSWPWTLSRGAAFAAFGKIMLGSNDIDQFCKSANFGPISRLTAALLAENFSGSLGTALANNARKAVTPDGFRADYRPFLVRNKFAGAVVCRAAELMRDLDDAEVANIGDVLLGDHGKLLVAATRRLRERRNENVEDVLPAVLDEMWSDGLSSLVADAISRKCTSEATLAASTKVSSDPRLTATEPAVSQRYPARPTRRALLERLRRRR